MPASSAWAESGRALRVEEASVPRGEKNALACYGLLARCPGDPTWEEQMWLRVGEATATLRFWRDDDGESHFEVVEKEGKLHVVRQAWIESTSHGLWDWIGGFKKSVFRS